MLTAVIRLDLSPDDGFDSDRADRHALAALDRLPDGARVVVNIGRRVLPGHGAAHDLHRHAARLDLVLEAHPDADVRAWLDAVRTGRLVAIA